jgi:transcriptional regulator with XRE-family HTH domain
MGLSASARRPTIDIRRTTVATYDAELLRNARALAGLTAEQLAERADLSRVSVSSFERGLTPAPETWQRLEKALVKALDETAKEIARTRARLS